MDTESVPGDTGSPEGVRANPDKDMGLMGQVREHTNPQGEKGKGGLTRGDAPRPMC